MARLLSTLVLLLSLLTFAAALVPRTPTATIPENEDVTKRQTNRKRILAREAMKRASGIMEVVAEHNSGGNWGNHGWGGGWGHNPHHSGKTYPKCQSDCGYPGLARYKNWDLSGDDLPGNPVNIGPHGGEEQCLEKCYKKSWHGDWRSACVGIEYTPKSKHGKCYLKGIEVSKGKFTNKSSGAKLPGTYLDLIGGCAVWAPFVPKEMDAICCNSR